MALLFNHFIDDVFNDSFFQTPITKTKSFTPFDVKGTSTGNVFPFSLNAILPRIRIFKR